MKTPWGCDATIPQSSKAQAFILEAIRARLRLQIGAQMVVIGDCLRVILNVLVPPALSECAALTATARRPDGRHCPSRCDAGGP
jgi:hypothetical protein